MMTLGDLEKVTRELVGVLSNQALKYILRDLARLQGHGEAQNHALLMLRVFIRAEQARRIRQEDSPTLVATRVTSGDH